MSNGNAFKILVAEDNEMNQKLIGSILKKGGYEFLIAESGRQAIELFQNESFQLILMDCQMPEVDGFSATKQIREIETFGGIPRTPIIAITANAMLGDREKCLSSGMDDFLPKPFKMNDVLNKINDWKSEFVTKENL